MDVEFGKTVKTIFMSTDDRHVAEKANKIILKLSANVESENPARLQWVSVFLIQESCQY